MTRVAGIAFALLVALGSGCNSDRGTSENPDIPAGAMAYAGYDTHGKLVVTGWIRLDVDATSATVSGAWSLHALADPSTIGPQTGSGQLSGTAQDGTVTVNLDPETVDNNVELTGTIGGEPPNPSSYDGVWHWITLAGERSSGTFHASRSS